MIENIPIIIQYKDGSTKEFDSLGKAAKFLGIPRNAASFLLDAYRRGYSLMPKEEEK